jgi:DNA-binding beta-propeller fold protein YncE
MSEIVTSDDSSGATEQVRSRRGRRIFALILVVLFFLLALASFLLFRLMVPQGGSGDDVDTAGVGWVRSIYGTSGAPADQFVQTQAAVTSADGTIWVTDGVRRALMAFTPDGRFINAISGPEEEALMAPSRFAVGPDGYFYVCETQLDVVRVFDPQGNEAGSFGVPSPVSIDVSEDRIVVGSVMGVAILDKQGEPLHVIGSRGQEDWQFDYVHGVAIAEDGRVFVADSFNNRLSAYDAEGNRLWIVRTGAPTNQAEMVGGRLTVTEEPLSEVPEGAEILQLPLGLTIDGAGRIVVVDMFESSLAVFDADDGTYIGRYGETGANDGQFFYPTSVDYDSDRDWFTVADALNNRVQIIRLPGSSGGGDLEAAIRRALTGPLRACFLPLLLLLIALVVWVSSRAVRRKRAAAAMNPVENSEDGV